MIGGVADKVARVVELAEVLYDRVSELREQVEELRSTTRETRDRVAALETELADQRALLEALAEAEGVDVAAVRSARADGTPDEADDDGAAVEAGTGAPAADGE